MKIQGSCFALKTSLMRFLVKQHPRQAILQVLNKGNAYVYYQRT